MRGEYYESLTGLRGVACLIVICSHLSNDKYLIHWLGHGLGQLGVMTFFVLSGFLMFHLYYIKPFNKMQVGQYIGSRLARIFPLFFMVVCASVLLSFYTDINFNYRLNSQTIYSAMFLISAPKELWTIPVEVQFYLLFIICWGFNRFGSTLSLMIFSVFSIISLFFGCIFVGLSTNILTVSFSFLIGGWLSFINGMKIKQLDMIFNNSIFLLVLFIVFLIAVPEISRELDLYIGDSSIVLTWFNPIAWCFVIMLFVGAVKNKALESFFKISFINKLGVFSFSAYLLHRPLLELCSEFIKFDVMFFVPFYLILLYFLSKYSFYYIERPGQFFVRKLISDKKNIKPL